jgi:hypothetical protein
MVLDKLSPIQASARHTAIVALAWTLLLTAGRCPARSHALAIPGDAAAPIRRGSKSLSLPLKRILPLL